MDKTAYIDETTVWRATRRWVACALMVVVMGTASVGHAQTVLVVYETNNPYQKQLLNNLVARTSKPSLADVTLQPIPGHSINRRLIEDTNPDLILSLGYTNSRRVLNASPQRPVLHALIPQARLYRLFPCFPQCTNQFSNHSQLLLDQPIERKLTLIQLIDPQARRIGLLKGDLNERYLDRLRYIAKTFGYTIDVEDTSPRLLGSHIDQLAQRVDILFATADPSLYNPSTIPEILLTSYRHHVPVLGFSKGFVRAGSIASVVSSLDQFAQQIEDIFIQLTTKQAIPQGVIYPKYYQVISNRNVARSLNLKFMDDAELLNRIQQRELAH